MAKLKLDSEKLITIKNEIVMAQKINEEELEPILIENLDRYTGMYWPRCGVNWDIMLNEIYPIIQQQLPAISFRTPRAFLKPRNKTYVVSRRNLDSGKMEEVFADSAKSAKTQEQILNYMLSQKFLDYKKQSNKVLLDGLLFPYGVIWRGYKGDFGMTEEQSITIENERIFCQRTNPMRFIHDPSVSISNIDEGKWVGRIIDIPLVDLLEDDKLDVDEALIKGKRGFDVKVGEKELRARLASGMLQGSDMTSLRRSKRNLIDFADKDFKDSRASKFVRLFEIYHRPTKKEKREGKKGKIVLLTDEQPLPLRVNEWRIKAEGWPSEILQFNDLPDNLFGLDDISTYKSIADQKNIIINLQIRNGQENTKNWVGVSADKDEEGIEQVQKGENTVIIFPPGENPRDRMFVASPGGSASSELYLLDGRIQNNLDEKSGVSDLKKGVLKSGEESATSVKIRDAGGSARPASRQDMMSTFHKNNFLYFNQLNKQFMTVKDAVRVVGSLDIEWSDKPSKEELQADVDVEIDVISMLPENPEKELRNLNTLLAMVIQGMTIPEVATKVAQEGKKFNLSPLIEKIMMRARVNDPNIFTSIPQDESQGFVSAQQLDEAKQNIGAAVQGQGLPFPPKPEDDHRAKLGVYEPVAQLLQAMGQQAEILDQLIQAHQMLAQQVAEQESKPGQVVKLAKPTVATAAGG